MSFRFIRLFLSFFYLFIFVLFLLLLLVGIVAAVADGAHVPICTILSFHIILRF